MAERPHPTNKRRKIGEREFADMCEEAIENTAAQLGVDPAALVKIARDGEFLSGALKQTSGEWIDEDLHAWIADKLAALRAGKQSGGE